MQNMQNMQWNVTDIFCILSIFQHIPTYWSAYFLAYFNIFSFIFPHSFSCIFLHIFFIEFSMKACNQKPKHRVYKPWEQVHCSKTRFLPGPHQTGQNKLLIWIWPYYHCDLQKEKKSHDMHNMYNMYKNNEYACMHIIFTICKICNIRQYAWICVLSSWISLWREARCPRHPQ